MFAQMLFTESRVDKLPELAFFAKDNIKAREVTNEIKVSTEVALHK